MSSKKALRRQFFVDPKVQGALVWRLILYWCTCLGAMTLMILCWRMLTGPTRSFSYQFDGMWFYYGPALLASAIMLPVVIIDVIQFSNRFAGPMVRLRRSMRALAHGEHVEPIHFRDHDYWQAFAEEFNAVVAQVQRETTDQLDDVVAEDDFSQTVPTRSGEMKSATRPGPAKDQQVTNTQSVESEEDNELETIGANPDR